MNKMTKIIDVRIAMLGKKYCNRYIFECIIGKKLLYVRG
ncbi:MAG: hypothetical protein BWX78_00430 [Firmicutes bacterium ADurb.Bin099]|nr:MAG: hypothetical protein BWX78_00430 [Firmicutes bacterium ADurb.Bin099]